MDSLKSFRNETGLSQQELAGLLGISRNFLAQVETGRSALPTNPLVLLSQLRQIWTNLPELTGTGEEEPFLNPEQEKKDAARIRTLNKEIAQLEKEIQDSTQQFNQITKVRRFCMQLTVLDWADEDRDMLTTLDLVLLRHDIALTKNGPKRLASLQFYLKQKQDEKVFLEVQ